MKIHLLCLPLLAALSACATSPQAQNDTTNTKPKSADEIREAEENKPPFVGMTKAQALARYGKPKQQTVSEEGEQWVYLLNFGEVMGKALIPFNFKVTPIRTGVLTFDAGGKVKKFRWDTPTES